LPGRGGLTSPSAAGLVRASPSAPWSPRDRPRPVLRGPRPAAAPARPGVACPRPSASAGGRG